MPTVAHDKMFPQQHIIKNSMFAQYVYYILKRPPWGAQEAVDGAAQ